MSRVTCYEYPDQRVVDGNGGLVLGFAPQAFIHHIRVKQRDGDPVAFSVDVYSSASCLPGATPDDSKVDCENRKIVETFSANPGETAIYRDPACGAPYRNMDRTLKTTSNNIYFVIRPDEIELSASILPSSWDVTIWATTSPGG